MADMVARGRNKQPTCARGHEQNEQNTHLYFWGGYWLRRCRLCDRMRTDRKPSSRKCTVGGCGEPHLAKGLCKSHYAKERWRRRVAAA